MNATLSLRGAGKGAVATPGILALLLAAFCALLATSAPAQQFPSKPLRIIIPFSPGGTNDILARHLAPKLTETLGQQAIVDNRPGGNTVIASEALLKAPPDGHTLLLPGNSHVLVPYLTKGALPFHSINDFAPVATLARTGLFLVVHPALPVNNLKQFIALAKSRPGELNSAAPGGSINQLATEMFNSLAGVKIVHIGYKGSGPAVTDLIGGHAQLSFQTPATVLGFVNAGKLKPLAISGDRPFPNPKVPTFTQAGLPGFDVGLWYGLLAHGKTPKNVVDRLSSEIAKILAMPDFREKVSALGLEIFVSRPEEYGAMLKAESEKFARVVKAAGIKPE